MKHTKTSKHSLSKVSILYLTKTEWANCGIFTLFIWILFASCATKKQCQEEVTQNDTIQQSQSDEQLKHSNSEIKTDLWEITQELWLMDLSHDTVSPSIKIMAKNKISQKRQTTTTVTKNENNHKEKLSTSSQLIKKTKLSENPSPLFGSIPFISHMIVIITLIIIIQISIRRFFNGK